MLDKGLTLKWVLQRYRDSNQGLTGNEGDLADEDPLGSEKKLDHDELSVLLLQVDRNVPGVFDREVGHVPELDRPVVAELVLLEKRILDFRVRPYRGSSVSALI